MKYKSDTFGKTPAAISLANILNKEENYQYGKYISKLFSQYNNLINLIDIHIPYCKAKKILFKSVFENFYDNLVNKSKNLPLILKTHAANVMKSNLKMAINSEKTRNDFTKKYYKLK